MSARHLRLVRRFDCELCEELEQLLAPYETAGRISLLRLDVDADASLYAEHAYRVPVLLEGATELLWGRVSASEVVQVLGDPPHAA